MNLTIIYLTEQQTLIKIQYDLENFLQVEIMAFTLSNRVYTDIFWYSYIVFI